MVNFGGKNMFWPNFGRTFMNIYGHWVRELGRANKWALNRRVTSCNAGWGYTIQTLVPFSPLSACQPIPCTDTLSTDRVGTPRARDRDCFLASASVEVRPVGPSVQGQHACVGTHPVWLLVGHPGDLQVLPLSSHPRETTPPKNPWSSGCL